MSDYQAGKDIAQLQQQMAYALKKLQELDEAVFEDEDMDEEDAPAPKGNQYNVKTERKPGN